jgi:insertion element IS1 protein InsB
VCYQEITCPRCSSLNIRKNGKIANRKQRYLCKNCRRQFITDYTCLGCANMIRELIVPMTLNGSGIRDTARFWLLSPNAVLKTIRETAAAAPEQIPERRIQDLELDEFWLFVGAKKVQRWTWYGFDRQSKTVAAFVNGHCTDANCRALYSKFAGSCVGTFYTDNWRSHKKCLPPKHHRTGKEGTRAIERNNSNFRTHLTRRQRHTICFSKSEEMHDAVIGLYIHYLNARQHQL